MMTAAEASALWGVSKAQVMVLCRTGRVQGAEQWSGRWMIPEGTQKPQVQQRGTPKGWKPEPVHKGIAYFAGPKIYGMCRDISDPARFVWINQDVMTVREMARWLGCTGRRVLELYDDGLRRWERDRVE